MAFGNHLARTLGNRYRLQLYLVKSLIGTLLIIRKQALI